VEVLPVFQPYFLSSAQRQLSKKSWDFDAEILVDAGLIALFILLVVIFMVDMKEMHLNHVLVLQIKTF
jgi:hypothetical protein